MTERVLIAGVGYRNLRDHSVGPELIDRLAGHRWQGDVSVEDLSFGPIAVVQRLQDDAPECRFTRAIFVAGISRAPWRNPGEVCAYRWDGVLPAAAEIQQSVSEAVTGVILLDNTLIVARHFGVLPEEIAVVEVEPLLHEFGDGFSEPVARGFQEACRIVVELAEHPEHAAGLPVRPLGGGTFSRVSVS